MVDNKSISLVSTCKDREKYLSQSLPTWVQLPFDEIIVVDWSSPGDVQAIIDTNQNGKIHRILVRNKNDFNQSQARNVGALFASGYYLLFCDADIILNKNFLTPINGDYLYTRTRTKEDIRESLSGTAVCTKSMFEQVNGYDERQSGYGHDDTDFYYRVLKSYKEKRVFDKTMLHHIDHPDYLRVAFYNNKDKKISAKTNRERGYTDPWGVGNVRESLDIEITYPDGKKLNN
jgi:glycosyltransferase involved in cell wall biosynthesis